MKLLRFLTLTGDARRALAEEFSNMKSCCVPRGICELWRAVHSRPDRCLTDLFKTIVEEVSWQYHTVNFGQKVNHAKMRAILNTTCGKSMTIEQLALLSWPRTLPTAMPN